MTTLKPINGTDSVALFQDTLDMLLADKSLKAKYNENTLNTIMEYVTSNIKVHTVAKDTLDKLIALHAKFLSALCPENFDSNSTNQTLPNNPGFTAFSNALHHLENFYNPLDNKDQTSLKESCTSLLNNDTDTPFSLASKMAAAFGHGAISGTSHAVTTIALDSAKSKGYTETQLKLLTAGSVVFNSLAIASYASIASYMENSNESDDAILEKMCKSFALSLISSTSLYALANGISYFAKSIENKLVKGFLNALPLAGNLCLLAQEGNSLTESAATIGTNVATAGLFTTAIQTGWNFFSKRRNAPRNTAIETASPPTNETHFYNTEDSLISNNAVSVYEEINEVTYYNTEHDEDGYMKPNRFVDPIPPALPERNRVYVNNRFFSQNPDPVSAASSSDDNSHLSETTTYLAMR